MTFEILDILKLTGFGQGIIFASVILFGRLFNHKINRYIAYSVIIIVIIGVNEWLIGKKLDEQYLIIDILGDDIPWILLFYAPLYSFFLKSVNHVFAKHKKLWLIYIPFFVFLLLESIIDLDFHFQLFSAPLFVKNAKLIYTWENYVAIAYAFILSGFSFYFIVQYSNEKSNKKWLITIWLSMLVLQIIWIFLDLTGNLYTPLGNILWISVSAFIYILIYKGLFQFYLAKNRAAIHVMIDNKQTSSVETKNKNPKTQETENNFLHQLHFLMEEEHLYRDVNLSQEILAKKMNLSAGYFSQVFNSSIPDKNFTAFINAYRIDEIKKMLLDPEFDRYNILSMALEAGFNSKSAFYSAFKKTTGITPAQFKKSRKLS